MDDAIKPPMVGREDSIGRLIDSADKVLHGNGEVVFIAGEAGIGKTRLAEEFEKLARELGFQVLVGQCIPGNPTPYIPFQEAFRGYFSEDTGNISPRKIVDSLKMAAPDIAGATPIIGPYLRASASIYKEYKRTAIDVNDAKEKVLFNTLDFLRKLSTKSPLLIRIEDLQWVDSGSMQIIHFLARNRFGLKVLIIGTYRTEEIGAISGLSHPLVENLSVMRKEGICQEINLQALTDAQMKVAIEGMLGGTIGNDLLQKISSGCEGNPLFMVEVIRFLYNLKAFTRIDELWQIKGGAAIEIPSTVKEVIMRRIDKLPREERRILDCGAVIGARFEPKIIEECLGMDELDLLEMLDSIEKRSQLVIEKDGLYQFGHELVRRVLYEQISTVRRKGLHKKIGEILEKRMPDEQILGFISLHFYYAGMKEKCIKYSLLAGESSLNQLLELEAIPNFTRVLELSKGDTDKDAERMHALERLGDAYRIQMHYNTAGGYFEEFLKSCKNPRDRVRVLLKLAWTWAPTRLGKGSLYRAKELVKEVEDSTEIDPIDLGFLFRMRMYCDIWEGKYIEADRNCEKSELIFRELGELLWLESQLTDHVCIFLLQGKVKDAENKLKEAESVYLERPNINEELDLGFWKGIIYLHTGKYEKSLEAFSTIEATDLKLGGKYYLVWGNYYKSLLFDSLGDFDRSRKAAFKSRDVALRTESYYNIGYSCIMIAHSSIQLGKIDEAEAYYLEALERTSEWVTSALMKGLLAAVKAELDAIKGNAALGAFENAFNLLRQGSSQGITRGFQDFAILYEAMVRYWYGKILERQGLFDMAKGQYLRSTELYEILGNGTQIEKIHTAMSKLN
jgi:tetratricopeptide (TPR) repeat protein